MGNNLPESLPTMLVGQRCVLSAHKLDPKGSVKLYMWNVGLLKNQQTSHDIREPRLDSRGNPYQTLGQEEDP
jgi:hypothetical protein